MIAAEITLWFDNIRFVVEHEENIHGWLLDQIGDLAPHRDCVDDDRPWCVTSYWGKNIYHFARESDATLFALRWT